ncbi:MAG: tyrosine-protein phosphatase [Lachnospiraceae bacterium]|nr:tyrosine-protein phosphatase [Lachnospiraceae bacterium]
MKRILLLFLVLVITTFAARGILQDPFPESETVPESTENVPVIEAGIESISKYGNIVLTVGPASLQALGYEPADVLTVRIGEAEIEMPVGTAYSDVDSGEPVCVFREDPEGGRGYVILAVNAGNLATALKVAGIRSIEEAPGYEIVWAEGYGPDTAVTLSLAEKQGYAEEYLMHQLAGIRTNRREDYAHLTDAEYANFRAVSTTGMGKGTLYRSSSPVNPALNRNREADAQILANGIRAIVNLADGEGTMKAYADYSQTAYADCTVAALDMKIDFQAEDFREKLAEGLRFLAEQEGPYLIHCNEGKDRTGFVAGVLECLMGADADEIVRDYMLTYTCYYGIEPDSPQYGQIAESNIKASLARAFGIRAIDDGEVRLSDCAHAYLGGLGLTDDEIARLKAHLSRDCSQEIASE